MAVNEKKVKTLDIYSSSSVIKPIAFMTKHVLPCNFSKYFSMEMSKIQSFKPGYQRQAGLTVARIGSWNFSLDEEKAE